MNVSAKGRDDRPTIDHALQSYLTNHILGPQIMTINNTVTASLPVSRAKVAAAFADQALCERHSVASLLQNERAAYSELLNQEGPFEDALHHWLVHEVLPSIRKSGGYLVDETFRSTAASITDDCTGLLMLPILADISERGLSLLAKADEREVVGGGNAARTHDVLAETFAVLDL